MKKLIILTTIIISTLSGCKTQQQTSSVAYDDVYANPKYSKQPVEAKHQNMDLTPQKMSSPDSSSAMKSGSATWYDDYNDYSKSSGQQGAANAKGYATDNNDGTVDPNLYDNTYSSNPDVNVYVGSSYDPFFWGSSVSIGCGFGWGWDSYNWGYPYSSWYYPYSYGGWGGYYSGYWDGYNDGYWDGHHGNPYYNTTSSFYYGQRRMLSSNGDGNHRSISRIAEPGTASSVDKVQRNITNPRESKITGRTIDTRATDQKKPDGNAAAQGRTNPSESVQKHTSSRADINKTPADRQHYRFDRSKQNQNPVNQRTENTTPNSRSNNQREIPSTKNQRSGSQSTVNRTVETQNYSSPAYKQPKYSQEYINPRALETRNNGTKESNIQRRSSTNVNNGVQNRSRTTSSSNEKRFATPSNNNSNTRSYSTPSRSNSSSGYSTPSRSSSTPSSSGARSGGGGSYSAPSRSGSSGSAPSGGGGGGGGRRK